MKSIFSIKLASFLLTYNGFRRINCAKVSYNTLPDSHTNIPATPLATCQHSFLL
uniref:Uncharacterized protein n=1 Tax=Octopus bimaculoides TaxID=37653 RepID=A0A0L8I914_OCTBM